MSDPLASSVDCPGLETPGRFRCIAVVVAGGKGLRMGTEVKKQFLVLDGIPVLMRTLAVFDAHPRVNDLVLVVPEDDFDFCRKKLLKPHGIQTPVHLVSGGITRQDSVGKGLTRAEAIAGDPCHSLVLVHDGVRPFVPATVIDACLDGAERFGTCIPVLPINDTVKASSDGTVVEETLDRSRLYRAQTPQVFRLDRVLAAFARARSTGFSGTDEASILEHAGIPVHMVPGAPCNIKLTTPDDLSLAGYLLRHSPDL